MPKKKSEPIITQAAILVMAGQHIQSEIIKLRREFAELQEKVAGTSQEARLETLRSGTDRQIMYHRIRLQAVETLYQIETGEQLGYLAELDLEGQAWG